jgi:UMF1 family MFS transporter
MNKQKIKQNALILAWGLYDLANQFFALNIVSLYFVRWVTIERNLPEIFYSIAFGISTFLVAVSTPILGAISDLLNRRMVFLIPLTLLSIIFTMILGISENIIVALIFFAIANFGCQAAIVFYNALLANIAPKDKIGLVSGFGRMLGYSGALLALYLIKPVVLKSGYQATFFPTGILFLIFALPCMILIKDKNSSKAEINLFSFFNKEKILKIFGAFKTTLFHSRNPDLVNFLKASFFGLCAVNVVIMFMSVYATLVFKLTETQVINLVGFSTLFAILGSFISGYISDCIGARKSLEAIFILWMLALTLGAWAKDVTLYWFVGSLVGLTLGSIWTVLRALAVRLVPVEKMGEIFGLFNLVAYLSSIVGSLFWGLILLLLSFLEATGYRLAFFSLNLFFLLGFVFLRRFPGEEIKKTYP